MGKHCFTCMRIEVPGWLIPLTYLWSDDDTSLKPASWSTSIAGLHAVWPELLHLHIGRPLIMHELRPREVLGCVRPYNELGKLPRQDCFHYYHKSNGNWGQVYELFAPILRGPAWRYIRCLLKDRWPQRSDGKHIHEVECLSLHPFKRSQPGNIRVDKGRPSIYSKHHVIS